MSAAPSRFHAPAPAICVLVMLLATGFVLRAAAPAAFPPEGTISWAARYSDADVVAFSFNRAFQAGSPGTGQAYLLAAPLAFTWTREGESVILRFAPDSLRPPFRETRLVAAIDDRLQLRLVNEGELADVAPTVLAGVSFLRRTEAGPYPIGEALAARYVGERAAPIGPAVPPALVEGLGRVLLHGAPYPNRERSLVALLTAPNRSAGFLTSAADVLLPATYRPTVFDDPIAEKLAAQPACPLPVLTRLFENHPAPAVWRIASEHAGAPPEWSQRYRERVLDGKLLVQEAAASDPGAPADLLLLFVERVQWAVLRNPGAPASVLTAAYARKEIRETTQFWHLLAGHPNATPEILGDIADRALALREINTLDILAAHPGLPDNKRAAVAQTRLEWVLAQGDRYYVNAYADPFVAPARIRELSTFPVPLVRYHVAANPALALADLERLADDPVEEVAFAARAAWMKRDPRATETIRARDLRPVDLPAGFKSRDLNDALDFLRLLADDDVAKAKTEWDRLPERWREQIAKGLRPPWRTNITDSLLEFAPYMGKYGRELLTALVMWWPGDTHIVELFAAKGLFPFIDVPAIYNRTISIDDRVVFEALLAAKLPVNGIAADGDTPLGTAASGNHADIIPTLLAHGADPAARNREGRTAAEVASRVFAIAALRLLATSTEHQAFLREVDAWAQPAPVDSPWVGGWDMGMVGAGEPSWLEFRTDGIYMFQNMKRHIRGAWRGNEREVIGRTLYSPDEFQPSPEKRQAVAELRFLLSEDQRQLTVKIEGESFAFRRTPGFRRK